jgi:hypothetical protein
MGGPIGFCVNTKLGVRGKKGISSGLDAQGHTDRRYSDRHQRRGLAQSLRSALLRRILHSPQMGFVPTMARLDIPTRNQNGVMKVSRISSNSSS